MNVMFTARAKRTLVKIIRNLTFFAYFLVCKVQSSHTVFLKKNCFVTHAGNVPLSIHEERGQTYQFQATERKQLSLADMQAHCQESVDSVLAQD